MNKFNLGRLFLYYFISGVIFAVVAVGILMLSRYETILNDDLVSLRRIRSNFSTLKASLPEMAMTVSEARQLIPADIYLKEREERILTALDGLKNHLKDAEISVSDSGGSKSSEVLMNVDIKGVLKDYTALANGIVYLESLQFPFFQITKISMFREESKGKSQPRYHISGIFKTPQI